MRTRNWAGFATCLLALGAAVAVGCGKDDSRGDASCSSSQTECSGECVDTDYDPDNCGECGNSCDDLLCSEGVCSSQCGAGTVACGGTCINLDFDPENCGECGNSCGDEFCDEGTCSVSCSGGRVACGGICTDTDFDPNNCGTCGTGCEEGDVCSAGECGQVCTNGTTRCDDLCIDAETDANNCGRCGTVCDTGDECVAGQCVLDCGAETLCDGTCVDTDTDPTHCGNCATSCDPGDACVAGDCILEDLAVTALNPPATFTPGGLKLTITGEGLDDTVTVAIDGTACESPLPGSSGKSLTCVVQPHAAGLVDVVVSRGTDSVTLTDSFTFRDFSRVDTIVGTGTPGVTNGTGDIAQVSSSVNELVLVGDTLYFNDGTNYQVRSVDLSGLDLTDVQPGDVSVQLLAGSGTPGRVDSSTPSEVEFLQPEGMTVIGQSLYVADTDWENNTTSPSVIRRVNLTTGATTSPIFGALAYSGIAAGPNGVIYAADCVGDSIQLIDTNDANSITPWIGVFAGGGGDKDGVGNGALLNCPYGMAVDRLGEFVYFTDWNNEKIKRVEVSSATVVTLAGTGDTGTNDGAGSVAQFSGANKLSISPSHLFIGDMFGCTVRMMELEPPYTVTTLAGDPGTCATADGDLATATLASVIGVHYSPKYGVFVGTGGWGYYSPPATVGAAIQLIH